MCEATFATFGVMSESREQRVLYAVSFFVIFFLFIDLCTGKINITSHNSHNANTFRYQIHSNEIFYFKKKRKIEENTK